MPVPRCVERPRRRFDRVAALAPLCSDPQQTTWHRYSHLTRRRRDFALNQTDRTVP
ncbi:hypothetical protein XAB3213_1250003 [Xanthomonas citri pv. bilvae]|nr:hypothetical protein XAB3213_1250003 [Xanthomonas citri pv. bilvae]